MAKLKLKDLFTGDMDGYEVEAHIESKRENGIKQYNIYYTYMDKIHNCLSIDEDDESAKLYMWDKETDTLLEIIRGKFTTSFYDNFLDLKNTVFNSII